MSPIYLCFSRISGLFFFCCCVDIVPNLSLCLASAFNNPEGVFSLMYAINLFGIYFKQVHNLLQKLSNYAYVIPNGKKNKGKEKKLTKTQEAMKKNATKKRRRCNHEDQEGEDQEKAKKTKMKIKKAKIKRRPRRRRSRRRRSKKKKKAKSKAKEGQEYQVLKDEEECNQEAANSKTQNKTKNAIHPTLDLLMPEVWESQLTNKLSVYTEKKLRV